MIGPQFSGGLIKTIKILNGYIFQKKRKKTTAKDQNNSVSVIMRSANAGTQLSSKCQQDNKQKYSVQKMQNQKNFLMISIVNIYTSLIKMSYIFLMYFNALMSLLPRSQTKLVIRNAFSSHQMGQARTQLLPQIKKINMPQEIQAYTM